METFYFGHIKVGIERVDELESRVYFNGELAMFISNSEKEKFIKSLNNVESEFRI